MKRPSRKIMRVAVSAALVTIGSGTGVAAASSDPASAPIVVAHTTSVPQAAATGCHLGNNITHVVNLLFDNVHFFRDNPNVPSDLEQMPHLLNFLESNGTVLSNNHTPLIAHTANDSVTQYTGLYGDRQGIGVSNTARAFNSDAAKTSDPNAEWSYWTSPIVNTKSGGASAAADTNPNMVYSPTVPAASTTPNTTDPAPWVPYTRAGCDVGDFSTANMVLENASPDIATAFGASSPEQAQNAADSDSYKDQESADYEGEAVHCAANSALCSGAKAVKYGQSTATSSATTDALPDEPGGYTGYQALFGQKYIAPELGAGTPNLTHTAGGNTYKVTDAAGNLVDESGAEIDNTYTNSPGFPGFNPTATQSLAMTADMQESGIPVTYTYISDVHEYKVKGYTGSYVGLHCAATPYPGDPVGPGDPCYEQNLKDYDTAFQQFFQRLSDDGITTANTLFVVTADEGDHFDGANANRAEQPTPAGCDGVHTPCTYSTASLGTAGDVGELEVDLPGLLKAEFNDPIATAGKLQYDSQGVVTYVDGQPGNTDPNVRTLAHDLGNATASNPYAGTAGPDTDSSGQQKVANWLADPLEERILHYADADPARTPTLTMFPKPDYYFTSTGTTGAPWTNPSTKVAACSGATAANHSTCEYINDFYAWDHGYYAPEINTTWFGIAGPGVANKGVDGFGPAQGPSSDGTNSGQGLDTQVASTGTWSDHTDIRPTELYLLGLHDDYTEDGRVLAEDLTANNSALSDPNYVPLAQCYKQLNSSVGTFGSDTLVATTAALKSGTATNDTQYTAFETQLGGLADQRDSLAAQIKNDLYAAANSDTPVDPSLTASCETMLGTAASLAGGAAGTSLPETPLAVGLPVAAMVVLGAGVIVRRRRRLTV